MNSKMIELGITSYVFIYCVFIGINQYEHTKTHNQKTKKAKDKMCEHLLTKISINNGYEL